MKINSSSELKDKILETIDVHGICVLKACKNDIAITYELSKKDFDTTEKQNALFDILDKSKSEYICIITFFEF